MKKSSSTNSSPEPDCPLGNKPIESIFNAEITLRDFGRMAYHVVYLPDSAARQLRLNDSLRLRVMGWIDDAHFEGACQPQRGRWYLILSKRLRRELKKSLGRTVSCRLVPAGQDTVHVPRELQVELDRRPVLRNTWSQLTPGKRRGFCHLIESAKRPETRESRVHQIIDEVMNAGVS